MVLRHETAGSRRVNLPVRIVAVPKPAQKAVPARVAPPAPKKRGAPVSLAHSGNLTGWGFSISLAGYVLALASLYETGESSFRSAEAGLCVSFLAYMVYASLVEWQGYGWARCDHQSGTVGQKNHLLRCRRAQWTWCLMLMGVVVCSAIATNGALISFAQLTGRYDAVLAGIALQLWLSWQVAHSVLVVRRFVRSVS